jgi:hypothetical protein
MTLTEPQLATLAAIADTLIPGDEHHRSAASYVTGGDTLARVLDTRADLYAPLCQLLDELADVRLDGLAETLRALWTNRPQDFETLTTTVAGAYYLHPDVRRTIGYEGPIRQLVLNSSRDTSLALDTVVAPLGHPVTGRAMPGTGTAVDDLGADGPVRSGR